MSVAVDSSSQFSSDPTNATPHTYVGPSVSAPAGALVLVFASCNSASGQPSSTINVTSVSGGHTATLVKRLSQADGGGSQNAPIGVWGFTANGSAFQVTQQDTSAGFAMSQAVYVLTGADTNLANLTIYTFLGTGTPSISGTASQNGSLVVFGLNDWNNTTDLPAGASGMTDDLAIQGSANAIPTYYGHKSVNSGAFTAGTTALAHQGGTNAIGVLVGPTSATAPVLPLKAVLTRIRSMLRIRRGRSAAPAAPQQDVWQEVDQPRRLRGLPRRRSRFVAPVPPQFNPPMPWAEIVQPRRLRGWKVWRGRAVTPVPPQFNPPMPWAEIVQPRRLRGLRGWRSRFVVPVPPQQDAWPVVDQPRRLRGLRTWRSRFVAPVPPQFNPPMPWAEIVQPRRLRGLRGWRGRVGLIPLVGAAAATPPPLPLAPIRHPVRPILRRARPVALVPPPPADAPTVVHARTPRSLPKPVPRRPASVPVVDAGLTAPRTSRRQPGIRRRVTRVQFVPAQVILVANPAPAAVLTRHRPMLWMRRRTFLLLPVKVCSCTVTRPNTGIVSRSSTGTVTRPNIGIVARPCTCA